MVFYPRHVMLPGFVNSHHHVGLTPLQLGTPDLPLELWIVARLGEYNAGQGLTRVQLAPANLHWCSDDTLMALNERSARVGVPMHMHLLETCIQKEYASRRTGGKTAVRHLHDLGMLSSRLTLGHGVWLTEEDIELLADAGTCVCHNCSSNFRLRSGIAPLNALEAKNVETAIGIDEAGLNDDRDMLQEMRLVLRAHRVPGLEAAEVPTVPQVVRMATEGGAKTTAFQQEIGRLEPGRFFDAVLMDCEEATYPYQDPDIPLLDALIQRAKAKAASAVYVDGEKIFEEGRFLKVDREAVLAEIHKELTGPRSYDNLTRAALARKITSHGRRFYEDYLRGGSPQRPDPSPVSPPQA